MALMPSPTTVASSRPCTAFRSFNTPSVINEPHPSINTNEVQLFVKDVTSGKPRSIVVDLAATLADVKATVSTALGVPSHHILLRFRGKMLNEGCALRDLGVAKGDTLNAVARLRGGMFFGGSPFGFPMGGMPIPLAGGGMPMVAINGQLLAVMDDSDDEEELIHHMLNRLQVRHRPEQRRLGTLTLYHVTDESGQRGIRGSDNTLHCSSSGAFGPGIYFADSIESANHKARCGHPRYVVTCRVQMGDARVARKAEDFSFGELRSDGLDSVYAPNGASGHGDPEFVVYSPSQVQVQSISRM